MALQLQAEIFLLLAILFLSSSGCHGRLSVGLDPRDLLDLQGSANCCPASGSQLCIEEQCPITEDQFGNIFDGNALTEFVVDFVSELSENGPIVEFSFDLGQVTIQARVVI